MGPGKERVRSDGLTLIDGNLREQDTNRDGNDEKNLSQEYVSLGPAWSWIGVGQKGPGEPELLT